MTNRRFKAIASRPYRLQPLVFQGVKADPLEIEMADHPCGQPCPHADHAALLVASAHLGLQWTVLIAVV